MGRPRLEIPLGTRFGQLTVVAEAARSVSGELRYLCRCACGNERTVAGSKLRHYGTVSCRACSYQRRGEQHRQHAPVDGSAASQSADYHVWQNLRSNAQLLTRIDGPVLEPDWDADMDALFADVGTQPTGDNWILARLDSRYGFVRGNVEWQQWRARHQHKRRSKWWVLGGETYPSIHAAAKGTGLSPSGVRHRCVNELDGDHCYPQYPDFD